MNKTEWTHVKNIFKRIKKLLKKGYIVTVPVSVPNKIQRVQKRKTDIVLWFSEDGVDTIIIKNDENYKNTISDIKKFKIERIKVCKHIQKGLTK